MPTLFYTYIKLIIWILSQNYLLYQIIERKRSIFLLRTPIFFNINVHSFRFGLFTWKLLLDKHFKPIFQYQIIVFRLLFIFILFQIFE